MTEAGSDVWDFETDVVIVGSGAGGLCAGLTVNAEGHASLVIEKNSTVGGASVTPWPFLHPMRRARSPGSRCRWMLEPCLSSQRQRSRKGP
jgi:cation diffusion facilitator CzcD-associated flavoprotein CzcO